MWTSFAGAATSNPSSGSVLHSRQAHCSALARQQLASMRADEKASTGEGAGVCLDALLRAAAVTSSFWLETIMSMPVQEYTPCAEASGCARAKGSPAVLLSSRMACGGGGGGLGGKKAASRGAVWDALSFVWIVTPPLIVTTGSTCTCHQHERLILGLMQPDKEAYYQHARALSTETTTTGLKT